MLHPQVDIQRWLTQFPPAQERQRIIDRILADARADPARYPPGLDAAQVESIYLHAFFAPADICSPRHLAVTEHMRAQAGGPAAFGPAKPADVLLPALGKPPRRDLSRIGGLPYRPATPPWPRTTDGREMSFLAQLNFADSAEALAASGINRLPGDVLLIFTPGEWCMEFNDDEGVEPDSALHFEWHPLGMTDLVSPDAVPRTDYDLALTYFELYRTTEHPAPPPPLDDDPRVTTTYRASKIGGIPVWDQEPDPGRGRFLAALHSINPWDEEFPFPNVPFMPRDQLRPMPFLMFGDVGTLNLFLTADDRVSWTIQCG